MPCDCNKTPGSYITNELAQARIAKFKKDKYPLLNTWVQQGNATAREEENLSYTKDQFVALMQQFSKGAKAGMRIYFGTYFLNAGSTARPPANKENLLTLIFSETINNKETGKFFSLDYTSAANSPQQLKIDDASDVVEYYQSFKRKKLQRSIGGGFLETKSIYYSAADILDWLCVIDCIEQQGKKVTNVQFTFAAYDKNTSYRDANDTAYHQQICFVIQIFSGNKLVDVQKLLWKDKQFNEADYDTGKPCPTRCPSGILLPAA